MCRVYHTKGKERKMLDILEPRTKQSHPERAALAELDKSSCFICVWGWPAAHKNRAICQTQYNVVTKLFFKETEMCRASHPTPWTAVKRKNETRGQTAAVALLFPCDHSFFRQIKLGRF
ncbi:hypothetical protein RRG08_054927 [Elysia crispata]|uniref:Uncharacterized protein n=1 Tax=Elysia crispata TaxID=231223 RepID=A0AAE0YSY0_9GAST|nr:hypothetical protein RRG08_054927 [Elysia crispata]